MKNVDQENHTTSPVLKIRLAKRKEKEMRKRSTSRTIHLDTNLLVYLKMNASIMVQTYENKLNSAFLIA
jgi:hypothetical protein